MNDTKVLIEKIKEGIQEKKGKKIIVADLTSIEDTICKYFVICQGNSPSQVSAIAIITTISRKFSTKLRIFPHIPFPLLNLLSEEELPVDSGVYF